MRKQSAISEEIAFTLDRVADFSQLAAQWRELETRANASFFQSWDWIGCWLEEAQVAPLALIGRQQGRIVALGVLVSSRQRRHHVIATDALLLHHLGQRDKDALTIEYNGFLVDREVASQAAQSCIRFLFQSQATTAPQTEELHLKGVTQHYEEHARASGMRQVALSRSPSWNVNLDEIRASGRAYLDHQGANTRHQIRRAIRLYEGRGPLTALRARSVDEAIGFFDAMKELHQAYWSSRGHSGSFANPFFESFHRRLIRTCIPRGTVEITRIAAGERPIGYLYNFVYCGWVFAYQSGFLYEDDARLKPGLVAHYLCIDRHLREGAHIYDFMAGESRYKSNLGTPGPEMLDLIVQRPAAKLWIEDRLRLLKRNLIGAIRRRLTNRSSESHVR